MRNLVRLILIGAFAAGTVAATTVGAGAGAILRVNRVTVVKVVDGPVTTRHDVHGWSRLRPARSLGQRRERRPWQTHRHHLRLDRPAHVDRAR